MRIASEDRGMSAATFLLSNTMNETVTNSGKKRQPADVTRITIRKLQALLLRLDVGEPFAVLRRKYSPRFLSVRRGEPPPEAVFFAQTGLVSWRPARARAGECPRMPLASLSRSPGCSPGVSGSLLAHPLLPLATRQAHPPPSDHQYLSLYEQTLESSSVRSLRVLVVSDAPALDREVQCVNTTRVTLWAGVRGGRRVAGCSAAARVGARELGSGRSRADARNAQAPRTPRGASQGERGRGTRHLTAREVGKMKEKTSRVLYTR